MANLVEEIRNDAIGTISVEDQMWIDEPDNDLDCPLGDYMDFTYEELSHIHIVSTLCHAR